MSSLAIVHGALGDTVLAEPALRRVARAWGALTVWGPAASRVSPLRAPRGPACATRDFPVDALGLWSDPSVPLPPAARAALAPFDRVLALCGPGPLAARLESLGGLVVDAPRAGEAFFGHAATVLLARVAERAGLDLTPEDDGHPRLTASPADRQRGRDLAGAAGYVVCHPGSGGVGKCWHPLGFARALARVERPVVVALGPAEVERGLDPSSFAGAQVVLEPSIDDLVALLAGADAYVGNDAGPTHLAAALGTPTVAVFGPTDPARWGPRGDRVHIVQGDLDALDPARVAAALARVLR